MSSIRNLITVISIIGPLVLFKQCECAEAEGTVLPVQVQQEGVDIEEQGGTVCEERGSVRFEQLGTNVLLDAVLPFFDPISADAMKFDLTRVSRRLRRDVFPSIEYSMMLRRYKEAIEVLGFKDNIPGFKSAYPLHKTRQPAPVHHHRCPFDFGPYPKPQGMIVLRLETNEGSKVQKRNLHCDLANGRFRQCQLVFKLVGRPSEYREIVSKESQEIIDILQQLVSGKEVPFQGFGMKLRAEQ